MNGPGVAGGRASRRSSLDFAGIVPGPIRRWSVVRVTHRGDTVARRMRGRVRCDVDRAQRAGVAAAHLGWHSFFVLSSLGPDRKCVRVPVIAALAMERVAPSCQHARGGGGAWSLQSRARRIGASRRAICGHE